MHRRHFLTGSLAATTTAVGGRAWSAPATDQRLLVIFLRGGYDAINVVIPTSSDFYYESRPTIAIARPDPANPNAALPLDADWSLHPALKDSIYPLWVKKQIAFVPFAGTDDMTRSHFETQDTIELGQPVGGPRNYRSGFMGRLAQELSGGRPIAFTAQPPLAFQGPLSVPNIAITSVGKPGVDDRQAKLIQEMYRDHDLRAAVAEGFSARDKAYAALAGEMAAANRNAVSPSGFELAARRVARLMKTDYNLAFLDVGGWDTHVNQGGVTGVLADRIGQLGRGLAALAEDLGPEAWSKTTVVVISEFGRTFKENGDRGTDHGHGSVYWVLGGAVKGGRFAGEQVAFAPKSLNESRDLPVLTDNRAMISSIIQRVYGMRPDQIEKIYPGGPGPMGSLSLV
ncbi:DUF1501 domain-containing protein [Caulobacter sp. BP25]|uniref:DUF1501 domain-containing protein n=1 Tax=Caulobacter sp. BP25 TaxID=2048900 RepID=UPI000C12A1E5|nr:DUF1501 domain-containing protein [Caulobacter sp. BP25]PHY22890.1 hypothetical protein CSW59_00440 [Caulobacter sp. BP25]